MVRQRLLICLVCGFALAALIVGCSGTEAEDAADAPQQPDTTVTGGDDGASQEPPALAGPAPELDLDTLRAETPAGTVEAKRDWENTYVGAVDEDLYISVSFSESSDTGEPREATVYLCDSEEIGEYLTAELDAGKTTIEGEELDVELSLAGDAVTGTVIQDGDESQPFTANEASGDAGLYTARFTFEDDDHRFRWVVLPDGSQRGLMCGPICRPALCCIGVLPQ